MGLFWSHPQVAVPLSNTVSKRSRDGSDNTESEVSFKKSKYDDTKIVDTKSTVQVAAAADEKVSSQFDMNNNSGRLAQTENTKKRHKFAIVIGYLGAAYQGMQRNPGARSIEGELEKALVAAGLIPDNLQGNLRKIEWSRAARTDKGVSAAGQVVSTYLLVGNENSEDIEKKINDNLPQDIRVLGMYSVSGGFHAKNACDRRRYSYIFPCWTLCLDKQEHDNLVQDPNYESNMKQKVDDFNELLKHFTGTHYFHNFTVGQTSSDGTCQRYILEFYCSLPFQIGEEMFLNVTVVGQSFLLHQIRKMIGLTIAIWKGWIPKEGMNVALSKHHRLETPMAPSLGLFLDECLFERYNERILKYHSHSPAQDKLARIRQRAEEFKRQVIFEYIACQEREYHVMERWMHLVSTKHPVDIASILAKHEELVNQEILFNRKRKEYMLDYISPMFDSSAIYGRAEETLPNILGERMNRCEEVLSPKPVSFYLRTPVEIFCIMGEVTKSLNVPCVFLTSGKDFIWAISVEESDDDFHLSLYDSRLGSNPCWSLPSVDESCAHSSFYSSFHSGWKVAASFFQNEDEICRKKISVVVDCPDSANNYHQRGIDVAYYCSAFVIYMKLMRHIKPLSKQEIAEILIQGWNAGPDMLSFDIYACLCARNDHLLVIRPNLETQKVTLEHYYVPEWLFERMEWCKLDDTVVRLEENEYVQIKALWNDWLQKVRIVAALEMKRRGLSWIAQSKDGVALQAHSPGMLLWKSRKGDVPLEPFVQRNKQITYPTSAKSAAEMLQISLEDFRLLFGEMIDMDEHVEWERYLHEFMMQVNNVECFLSNWTEMLKEDTPFVEKEALLERCLDSWTSHQHLVHSWLSTTSSTDWWTRNGCFQYCIEYNAVITWTKLVSAQREDNLTGNNKSDIKVTSLHSPSSGICFWYPHFARFVRRSNNSTNRKIRKSARKYRLR